MVDMLSKEDARLFRHSAHAAACRRAGLMDEQLRSQCWCPIVLVNEDMVPVNIESAVNNTRRLNPRIRLTRLMSKNRYLHREQCLVYPCRLYHHRCLRSIQVTDFAGT